MRAPTGKLRGMATKIQRARRVGGIAIGAVKAIFRTGKAWGTTRTRVASVRRPTPTVTSGAALAAGAVGGAAGAYFLDPKNGQRRRRAVGKRMPVVNRVTALVRRDAEEEDVSVDTKTVQMAAGNGAGSPVPAKEAVAAGA
jgi:hypothetical protein